MRFDVLLGAFAAVEWRTVAGLGPARIEWPSYRTIPLVSVSPRFALDVPGEERRLSVRESTDGREGAHRPAVAEVSPALTAAMRESAVVCSMAPSGATMSSSV
jgi:hypothetical protein